MDDFVSKEFPFLLTKKAVIYRTLVNRLADDLLEEKGFSATSKSLEKAYSATYFPTPVKGQSGSVYCLRVWWDRACYTKFVRLLPKYSASLVFFCRGTSRTSFGTEF